MLALGARRAGGGGVSGAELLSCRRTWDFLQVDPFKISLSVVAALLTIVGFSINDTIVVFDRIREVRGKSPDLTRRDDQPEHQPDAEPHDAHLGHRVDASIILYFVGGPGIHAFAFCDGDRRDRGHVQLDLHRGADAAVDAKAGRPTAGKAAAVAGPKRAVASPDRQALPSRPAAPRRRPDLPGLAIRGPQTSAAHQALRLRSLLTVRYYRTAGARNLCHFAPVRWPHHELKRTMVV